MKCEHPLAMHGALMSCGKCVPCTVNKKRIWTHRLELEAAKWEENCFLTLTYDDQHLPADGSLNVKTVQDFIKRLRRYHEPLRLRHFTCGEYGDLSWRPHYHSIVFNFPTCERHQSEYGRNGLKCCQRCEDVRKIWGFGNVYLGRVEPQSMQYVCGYVVKKMTHRLDLRLNGRHPEFSRMSLKPGIGASAMDDVKVAAISNRLTQSTDQRSITYGQKTIRPIGRYLTRSLRMKMGREPTRLQSRRRKYEKKLEYTEEMRAVQMAARSSEDKPAWVSHYKEINEGKFASQMAKLKLKGKRNETL